MLTLTGTSAVGPHVEWVLGDASTVVRLASRCERVGIDVPVGLAPRGSRTSDREARALLGPARSSLFPTAPVGAFAVARRCGTGREVRVQAQEASRAAGGTGISTQSWGLVAKVLEVEDAVRALGTQGRRVLEVHPETSFRLLAAELKNGEAPPGKRTAAGRAWRTSLLSRGLGLDVAAQLAAPGTGGAGADDLLDALAAAWSAHRSLLGRAKILGAGSEAVWSDGRAAPGRAVIVV